MPPVSSATHGSATQGLTRRVEGSAARDKIAEQARAMRKATRMVHSVRQRSEGTIRPALPAGTRGITRGHRSSDHPAAGALECFKVRGRPFIASVNQPCVLSAETIRSMSEAVTTVSTLTELRSVAVKPWQAGLRSSGAVASTERMPSDERADLLKDALLRLCWQNDDEWPWAAVFRNSLLNSTYKPGLSTAAVQQELSETEEKLVHTMQRFLFARLHRHFLLWRRRAVLLKRLTYLRRPIVRPWVIVWAMGASHLTRARTLLHRRLRRAWEAWAQSPHLRARKRRALGTAAATRTLCDEWASVRGCRRAWVQWRQRSDGASHASL